MPEDSYTLRIRGDASDLARATRKATQELNTFEKRAKQTGVSIEDAMSGRGGRRGKKGASAAMGSEGLGGTVADTTQLVNQLSGAFRRLEQVGVA